MRITHICRIFLVFIYVSQLALCSDFLYIDIKDYVDIKLVCFSYFGFCGMTSGLPNAR